MVDITSALESVNDIRQLDDIKKIKSSLSKLKKLIKKDKNFVNDVYDQLTVDKGDVYSDLLNYFDGAMYVIGLKKDEYYDLTENFVDGLGQGWTPETYSDYDDYKKKQFKPNYLCETSDLYTHLDNLSSDEGFASIPEYIHSNYSNTTEFCISLMSNYYASNIEYRLKQLGE